MVEENVKKCKIPLEPIYCERLKKKCKSCECRDKCDYYWISELWEAENKKKGNNTTLGVCLPIILKKNIRDGLVISITGKYDFCMFNIPKRKNNYVVISDIFVSEEVRGQHLATKLLNYLMKTYDRDIFAKCVRGSSAEEFWRHVGEQINANSDKFIDNNLYEERSGKRDLGWYIIRNKSKKQNKENLW